MKKIILFFVFILASFVFAQGKQVASSTSQKTLSEVLPNINSKLQNLLDGEVLSQSNGDGSDVSIYAPKDSNIFNKLSSAPTGKDGFAVASCSLVKYPKGWDTMSKDEKLVALYNVLGRVSTQKGLTYISRRAGYKRKTLFSKSYYITSPYDTKTVVPDYVVKNIPAVEVRYVFQEDSTFSENTYEYKYKNSSEELFVELTNCTPMKYHGITCLKSEELKMCISAYPLQEGILVTSAAIVTGHKTTVTVVFVKVDLADSLKRRTDALHAWLKEQVNY